MEEEAEPCCSDHAWGGCMSASFHSCEPCCNNCPVPGYWNEWHDDDEDDTL